LVRCKFEKRDTERRNPIVYWGVVVMRYTRAILVGTLLLGALSLTGCFSSRPEDIEAFLKPYEVEVTAKTYVFEPPDAIAIQCSMVPEIDGQSQVIRPDGKVSFELIGDIEVAGKTIDEVEDVLEQKVEDIYTLTVDNPIDVRVSAYLSKVYYLLGQVGGPGPRPYTGRDTLFFALAQGQPNPMAWEERVQVIRPSTDKTVRPGIFEVDFKRMMEHGDLSKDVLLQEGDIVYVPPTVLATIALTLEEIMMPIGRVLGFGYMTQAAPYAFDGGDGYRGGGYRGYRGY
jgi:polysaccharide export outer membrane protein